MCFPSAEFNCFTAAHYRHIELWSSNPKLWSRSQRVESSKSLEQTLLLQSHSAWAQTLKQNSIKQTTLTELTFWWHKSYCFSPAIFSLFAGLFFGGFAFFSLLFVWGFFSGFLSPGSQNLVWTFIRAKSKCLVDHKASEPGKFPRVCAFIPNISQSFKSHPGALFCVLQRRKKLHIWLLIEIITISFTYWVQYTHHLQAANEYLNRWEFILFPWLQ